MTSSCWKQMPQDRRPPTPETLLEHREWLRAIARGLVHDESAVDEVEQRTWMTVLRNREPVQSARGWLRRVVHSAAVDEHRSTSRRHAREEAAARPEALPSTEHLVEQADAQRAVAAAVTKLPEPYRTTVLLRYFEELPPRGVAARMGVPVETVRTRLRRAHELLRGDLDREFGDRRAWLVALLPLARTRWPIPAAASITGAIVMTGAWKAVAAAAVVAALAVGVVMATGSGSPRHELETADAGDAPVLPPRTRHPAPGRFALVGVARSRHTGLPVAGARVLAPTEFHDVRTDLAVADERGAFRAVQAAAGRHLVVSPGFRSTPIDVEVPETGDADVGTVWMEAAASLVVEVRGPGGAPVADAEVSLIRRRHHGEVATTHSYLRSIAGPESNTMPIASARTRSDGDARFDDLAPGVYELVARHRDFAAAGAYVELPVGSEVTKARVHLARGHRLEGRLVHATGEPASGWLVSAQGSSGWDDRAFVATDADGRFVLDGVRAGEVRLAGTRTRAGGFALAVVRVPDVASIEVRLPRLGGVSGHVRLPNGTPVADAEIGIQVDVGWNGTAGFFARSDPQGRYQIGDVPVGPLGRFQVRRAGMYQVGPQLVRGRFLDRRDGVDAGVAPFVPPGGTAEIDVTMAPGSRLHGRVLSADGPVAAAWVYLHRLPTSAGQEWETAVTDAAGRYEFDYLAPGAVGVVPLHPAYGHRDAPTDLSQALSTGRLSAALRVDLPEGGAVERDLHVEPGARVQGRVTGDAGPVTGASVRLRSTWYSSPPLPSTTTDAEGAFVFPRVAGGPWPATVHAEKPGLAQTTFPDLRLALQGAIDGLEIRMAARPRVSGRVTSADGSAVTAARVTLATAGSAHAPPVVTWTDAGGAYDAEAPGAGGKMSVSALAESGAAAQVDVEVPAVGAAGIDVVLPRAFEVAGRVVSAAGAPLAGARVAVRDATSPVHYYHGERWGEPEVTRAVTRDDGSFTVVLPTGDHALAVASPEWVEEVVPVRVPQGDSVLVTMQRAARLFGTLRDASGRPLAATTLSVRPGPAVKPERLWRDVVHADATVRREFLFQRTTDTSGGFSFPGLPPGEYTLVASLPGGEPRGVREVQFGPLATGDAAHDLTIDAPLSAEIHGRVVLPGGGTFVLAEVTVLAIEPTPRMPPRVRETTADANGTFRIEGLTASHYTLQVRVLAAPSRNADGMQIWTVGYERTFRNVRPSAAPLLLDARQGVTMRGRLVDESETPLGGWWLVADPVGEVATAFLRGARTDEQGRFEFQSLEPEDHRLRVAAPPGERTRRLLGADALRGGSDVGAVVATLESRIRGELVDAHGAARAGVAVRVFPIEGGAEQRVTTDERGGFEATGLDAGRRYAITLREGWEGPYLAVVAAGGEPIRLVGE